MTKNTEYQGMRNDFLAKAIITSLIAIMALCSLVIVSADTSSLQNLIQTGNTKPTIEVNYNESIQPLSIIVKLNDSMITYSDIFSAPQLNDSDSDVKLELLRDLVIGRYTFSIKACDKVGNCNQEPVMQHFEIELSDLNITLVQPRFGIFRTVSGNLTINTNRESRCRFGLSNKSFNELSDPGTNHFVNDDLYIFTHSTFEFKYVNNPVYFVCMDKYGKSTTQLFTFKFDPSLPYIKVEADNVYSPPIESSIYVESINTEVQCKYSKNDVSFDQMTEFTGFNLDIDSKYQFLQEQYLTAYDLVDKKTNRYYIQCISKSGVLSEKKYVDIIVDTERGLYIDIIYPDYYVNTTYVKINLSTSVAASCFYREEDKIEYDRPLVRDDSMKIHISQSSLSLDEGLHNVYVRCTDISNIKTSEESKEFIVDLTRPVVRNVRIKTNEDNSKINSTTVIVTAESDEGKDGSGINRYEYMIYKDDPYSPIENLTSWRYAASRNGQVEFTVTYPFVNDSSYYVKVRAIDNAGWTSDDSSGRSNTVKYSSGRSGNGGVICFDIANKCAGLCNKCNIGGACNTNSDCVSNFCLIGKCSNANCSDTVKNGDETDSDCGGNCEKCALDRDCLADSDCESGNCISKRCSGLNSCRNSELDVGETDIDCGGQCDQCDTGMNCDVDSDCITNYCKIGELSNKCFKESKDSDGDSILDEDDNCQDEANQDQEDLDNDKIGDACDKDKDGDGISNDWEESNGFDPMNPDDALTDPDGDGLTNFEEYNNDPQTDPNKKDTDGDGYSDFDEIKKYQTDPTDPESRPRSILLLLIVWIIFTILGFISGYYLYYSRKLFISNENKNMQNKQGYANKVQTSQTTVPNPGMSNMQNRTGAKQSINPTNNLSSLGMTKNNSRSGNGVQTRPDAIRRNLLSTKPGSQQLRPNVATKSVTNGVISNHSVAKPMADTKLQQNTAPNQTDAGKSSDINTTQKTDAIERLRGLLRAKRSKMDALSNELGTKKTASKQSDDDAIENLRNMSTRKKSSKAKK